MQSQHKIAQKIKLGDHSICPDCSLPLQLLDNLKYCQNCMRCPTLMDDCIREPNYNFKQHHQEHRLQAAVKIQMHIKDIMCRLAMRITEAECESIIEKALSMHRRRGANRKGYKEEAAAIIFTDYEDEIRMTAHQFCNATGLNRKKFNKMYISYRNIKKMQGMTKKVKQIVKLEDEDEERLELKEEEEEDEDDSDNEDEFQPHLLKRAAAAQIDIKKDEENQSEDENNTILQTTDSQFQQRDNIIKTIQKLYSKLFPQIYLQKHKVELIKSITDKCMFLSQHYAEQGKSLKKYFRAPAMIYNVIKLHGYRLAKKKYIELVQKQLQVKLTDRMISKYAGLSVNATVKMQEDESGSSPTSLQNRNQSPTKSDACVA